MQYLRSTFLLSTAMAASFWLPFVTAPGTARPSELQAAITQAASALAHGAPLAEIDITLLLFAASFALALVTAIAAFAGYAWRLLTLLTGLSPALPFAWIQLSPAAAPLPIALPLPAPGEAIWPALQAAYDIGAPLYAGSATLLLLIAIVSRNPEPDIIYDYARYIR